MAKSKLSVNRAGYITQKRSDSPKLAIAGAERRISAFKKGVAPQEREKLGVAFPKNEVSTGKTVRNA